MQQRASQPTVIQMEYLQYIKSQISEEEFKKISGMGLNLSSFVPMWMWEDFVNFEERRKKERGSQNVSIIQMPRLWGGNQL